MAKAIIILIIIIMDSQEVRRSQGGGGRQTDTDVNSRKQYTDIYLAMVCIILMLFISAGSVSMIVVAVPLYKGSIKRSRVYRNFTLSLASLAASVTLTSICQSYY